MVYLEEYINPVKSFSSRAHFRIFQNEPTPLNDFLNFRKKYFRSSKIPLFLVLRFQVYQMALIHKPEK